MKDLLKVIADIRLYALDSIIMPKGRIRNWNYSEAHLAGFTPDVQLNIKEIHPVHFVELEINWI